MFDPTVRIVLNTSEPCAYSTKPCMTLYFRGAPTIKQIMHTAKHLRCGFRIKPDLNSRSLRVYTRPHGNLVRCQIVDS